MIRKTALACRLLFCLSLLFCFGMKAAPFSKEQISTGKSDSVQLRLTALLRCYDAFFQDKKNETVWDGEAFPQVYYVAPWQHYVAEDKPGGSYDSILRHTEDEYNARTNYHFENGYRDFQIERKQTDMRSTYGQIQVSFLSDDSAHVLVLISLLEKNDWRGWVKASHFFYTSKNGKWQASTEAKGMPQLADFFFAHPDLSLVEQYEAVTVSLSPGETSGEYVAAPLLRGDLNCNGQWDKSWNASKELNISKKKIQKICATTQQLNPKKQLLRWDEKAQQFILLRLMD